ncbi:hypothetical protein L6249_00895 [Candidatus Parcubacteria bacterium]|nr:hypothetical protein [Candidatus Parcubacteria bacterium]
MLEKLFGSRARVKILNIFLLNPREKYYIRQLSRNLKLQLNSTRRELENLEKFGILTSVHGVSSKVGDSANDYGDYGDDGNNKPSFAKVSEDKPSSAEAMAGKQEKKYYRANIALVLFEEIKALVVKAQILYGRDFVSKLQKIGKIKLLILTGFFANNNTLTDLLIVGNVNKNKLLKLIKELELELGREINFTLMDSREFKYRRDITDIFLYEILEGRKIVIIDEAGVS